MPGDSILHTRRRENLTSHKLFVMFAMYGECEEDTVFKQWIQHELYLQPFFSTLQFKEKKIQLVQWRNDCKHSRIANLIIKG
jgi:hypothetical protein